MTRARLSQLDDWQLERSRQDVRGMKLLSENGHTFGTIEEMIVNTDTEYVDAFILDDGSEVPATSIRIGTNGVYMLGLEPVVADTDTRTADIVMTEEPAYAARTERAVDDEQDSVIIPIVAEQISVGKRVVEGGGVRVQVDVEEVPVSKQVTLQAEMIDVHREKVDRPVSDHDQTQLQGSVIEVFAHEEHAVVDKEARLVEEVVISKDVQERTQTLQETVRHTKVDIENLADRDPPR